MAPTSSSKSGTSTTKRLLHELANYEAEPNPALLKLGPRSEGDLFEWEAVMKGPEGSAYEGATFPLRISIPPTYPLLPPTPRFLPPNIPIHANIHPRTGEICLDLLKNAWSPAYTLSATLGAVSQLLTSPEVDSPLNVDVAGLLRQGDVVGAEGLVRFFVQVGRGV